MGRGRSRTGCVGCVCAYRYTMSLEVLDHFAFGAPAALGRGRRLSVGVDKRASASVGGRGRQALGFRRAFALLLGAAAFDRDRVLAFRPAAFARDFAVGAGFRVRFFFGVCPSSVFRWAIDLAMVHVPFRGASSDIKHYDTDAVTAALVYVAACLLPLCCSLVCVCPALRLPL